MKQRTRIVSVGLVVAGAWSAPVLAQTSGLAAKKPQPEFQRASLSSGRVAGVVRDDQGIAVSGVTISALGTTNASALSDLAGRFLLALPPGQYVIRARREGYVSSYRDLVMVRPSTSIERVITVSRVSNPGDRPVMIAGIGGATPQPVSVITDPDHPHDQTSWYLRHGKRPVVRDIGGVVAQAARDQATAPRPNSGFFDWALASSARLATSFFVNTDFTGQVNFLTTSAIDPASEHAQPEMPQSIAYLSVSAPVGGAGDWRVRGAMNAADLSSWVLLGEFVGRRDRAHAYSAGMAYSTQAYGDASAAALSTVAGDSRSVGAIYASDHWAIGKHYALDYGARLDRYSYVADAPNMFSPHVGGRAKLFGRLSAVGSTAQRMVAPGATEFLAPAAAGPWLPPQRTFSTLAASGLYRAERVRHFDLGLEQDLGNGRSIAVRRFRQDADDQTATIFGLNTGSVPSSFPAVLAAASNWAPGHYAIAAVGGVEITGWTMRAAGGFGKRVSGSVEYSLADADWAPSATGLRRARAVAPSTVRVGTERLQDLLTSVEIDVPESNTHIAVVCRMNSAFSRAGADAEPGAGARFDMQVNQALPFQPVRGGRLEVLVAVSNLMRDLRQAGSMYDELLTVSPPLRLLGGVQIRF